jgi:hypothetical protein
MHMAGSERSSLASPRETGGRVSPAPAKSANGNGSDIYASNGSSESHGDESAKMPLMSQGGRGRGDGGRSSDQAEQINPALRSSADFGFTGTFVSDDLEVTGSLQIIPNRVILWASGTQLASWDISECRVERRTVTKFDVEAGGEVMTFTADDPGGLEEAVTELEKARPEPPKRRRTSEARSSAPAPEAEPVPPPPAPAPVETPAEVVKKPAASRSGRRTKTGSYQVSQRAAEARAEAASASPMVESSVMEDSVAPPAVERDAPPVSREPDAPVIRRPRIKNFQAAPGEPTEAASVYQGTRERAAALPVDDDELPPETPAEEALVRARGGRVRAARWLTSDYQKLGIKVGAVALAAVLLGGFAYSIYVLAGGTGYEPAVFVEDPTASTVPRTVTTAGVATPTTAPPPPTTLFQTDPGVLTDRWNLIAEASRPELMLLRDLSSPVLLNLTSFMTLEGVLDPAAGYLSLRSTPTATPEGDGAILTTLGMVIAISDPSLEPVDRRLLLKALGLDVRDPQLAGLDASLSYNGLNYRLTYFQDQNLLEFAVTPAVAATATTVN